MNRFLVPFLAALLGAALGAGVVTRLAPPRDAPAEGAAVELSEVRADLTAELAALRARLDGLGSGPAALLAPGRGATTETPAAAGSTGDGPPPGVASTALESAVVRAVEAAFERRAEAERAAKAEADRPKARRPLADVARELALSSSQEAEIRGAYRDAVERMLKVLAEPESDVETLRRELEDARGDRGKGVAVMARYMPKFLTKLGDVMAIQAERDQRIQTALGPEQAQKWPGYRIVEEDPFDLGGEVSVGVGAGAR